VAHTATFGGLLYVSVIVVRAILEEVERRGIERGELLRDTALSEEKLADMRTMVAADVLDLLVERAIVLTKNPALGLTIGMHSPDSVGQILSHLALSVPTLREAYGLFERFSPILIDDLHLSMQSGEAYSVFRFDFHEGMKIATTRFAAEILATTCVRIVQDRFGRGERCHAVRFHYSAPNYRDRYDLAFGCPVHFDQPTYGIEFSTAMLDYRQPHADSAMAAVLRQAAELMLTQVGTTLTLRERVGTLLRQKDDLCNVDTERLARDLGMSHRVLRRRLTDEGTSLSRLLEEARIDRARVELLRPGATIKQTAESLGYSEPSAVHRAFKRWTGQTPVAFVREQVKPTTGEGGAHGA
jgi:AraC-like DNA-binding protein